MGWVSPSRRRGASGMGLDDIRGVGPWWRTGAGHRFDRLPGELILEL